MNHPWSIVRPNNLIELEIFKISKPCGQVCDDGKRLGDMTALLKCKQSATSDASSPNAVVSNYLNKAVIVSRVVKHLKLTKQQ
jgi:hypothetical protein